MTMDIKNQATRRTFALAAVQASVAGVVVAATRPASAQAQNQVFVVVTDYGATPEATDNSSFFNDAINAASGMGGGVVYVPPAPEPYMINPLLSVVMRSNVTLWIDGGATLKAKKSGSESYAVVSARAVDGVAVSRIAIIGSGRILGERNEHDSGGGAFGMGIRFYGVDGALVDGVSVEDCWGDGIYVGSDLDGALQSKNVSVQNCRLVNNRRQGISVTSMLVGRISSNAVSGTNGASPGAGIDIEPNEGDSCVGLVVTDNVISDNDGCGILIYHTAGADLRDISVLGNVCASNGKSASGGSGIAIGHVSEATVADNVCSDNSHYGIYVYSEATNANKPGNLALRGNRISRSGLGGISFDLVSGREAEGVDCSGNTLIDCGADGVSATRLVRSNINSNVIKGMVGRGISLLAGCKQNTISGNSLSAIYEGGVRIGSVGDGGSSCLTGNTFVDCCLGGDAAHVETAGHGGNSIQGNLFVASPGVTTKPLYCIRCYDNGNLVTNNLCQGAYTSAAVYMLPGSVGNSVAPGNKVS